MMYGQGPYMDTYGYGHGHGHGYCGCGDEPFYGFGGYPTYRGGNFALILVLFILLVIIGATRF